MNREILLNIRRHLMGMLKFVEDELRRTPVCLKCYQEYGFIDKCYCDINKSIDNVKIM